MNNLHGLALKYGFFAVTATAANIFTQNCIIMLYDGPCNIWLSLLIGTASGLIVKYLLDKRYIFSFRPRSNMHDLQTFFLYSSMGLLTTVFFWILELGFQHIFKTDIMRYVGGGIGLVIGYLVKYQLDKRYVFCSDMQ